MSTRCIAFAVVVLLEIASHAQAVQIKEFRSLKELIEKSDAIVVMRIEDHVDAHVNESLFGTHLCMIYHSLKGDMAQKSFQRLQLIDTSSPFVTSYVLGSAHLVFLEKKQSKDGGTVFRTVLTKGANVRLPWFGREKPLEGQGPEAQIRNLVKSAIEHFDKERETQRKFLTTLSAE